jgi:hypothetical protein
MQYITVLQLLILLIVANGSPLVATKIVGDSLAYPLCQIDRRGLLFGSSKTWHGTEAPLLGLNSEIAS